MRAVVQRASTASVEVAGGAGGRPPPPPRGGGGRRDHTPPPPPTDTAAEAAALARKIYQLRILPGEKSAADTAAPLLVISQFTLYGETSKGRRPTWQAAAPGPVAEPLVDAFVAALREAGAEVETGIFGADMQVMLVNDGPVTLILEG